MIMANSQSLYAEGSKPSERVQMQHRAMPKTFGVEAGAADERAVDLSDRGC
jgi:hypothetical protein